MATAVAKREVAESSFDFLHYSIVDTFSRYAPCCQCAPSCLMLPTGRAGTGRRKGDGCRRGDGRGTGAGGAGAGPCGAYRRQACMPLTQPPCVPVRSLPCHDSASATRAHPEKDLDVIGFQVGHKLAERYAKDKYVPLRSACLQACGGAQMCSVACMHACVQGSAPASPPKGKLEAMKESTNCPP